MTRTGATSWLPCWVNGSPVRSRASSKPQRQPASRPARSDSGVTEAQRSRQLSIKLAGALGPDQIEADIPPEPEKVRELRERQRRAVEVCQVLGPGPWRGTRQQRANNTGAYNANRQAAIEAAQKLRAAGVNDHLYADPPPPNPYPRQRRRPVSFWGPR